MLLQLVSFYGICVFLDYVWANELNYGSLNFVYVFCGENMYIYCISSTKLYTFSNIVVNTEEINNTHLLQVAGLAACLCRPRQDAPPP